MAFDFKAALKKPWVKYALIAIGVIGAYYIYQSVSGGGSSSSTNSDGMSDAEVQAEAALVLEIQVRLLVLDGYLQGYAGYFLCEVFLKASAAPSCFFTWLLRATLMPAPKLPAAYLSTVL